MHNYELFLFLSFNIFLQSLLHPFLCTLILKFVISIPIFLQSETAPEDTAELQRSALRYCAFRFTFSIVNQPNLSL